MDLFWGILFYKKSWQMKREVDWSELEKVYSKVIIFV